MPNADIYSKLLLHFDGVDGSTTILDSSSSNRILTAYGNAKIDTTQSKFGGASGVFDGTGDYLILPDSDDFAFGTGDFTVDFWIRFNSVSAGWQYILTQNQSGSNWTIATNNGDLSIWSYASGSHLINVSCDPDFLINTWYHVAIVRNGTGTNCLKIYVNGIDQSTTLAAGAWNGDFPNRSADLYIGSEAGGGSTYFNGWLDEFHISKGVARWTTNFTPSTTEYVDEYTINGIDSYTKLMLHCNGTNNSTSFKDSSDSNRAITTYGDAKLTTSQFKFGGVSGSFDGTGDYLQIANSSDFEFGTGDFTIDAWIRFSNLSGVQNFFAFATSSGAWQFFWNGSSNQFDIWGGATNVLASSAQSLSINIWYHIAFARYGNDWTIYLNGTNIGTVTDSRSIGLPNHGNQIVIGAEAGLTQLFNGYIDEYRVSKGIARWTANFNPPISMYRRGNPDCYTKLLLHCNGTDASQIFTDISGNSAIAVNHAQIDTAQSKFGGASALFDGTDDYIAVANSTDFNLGYQDFTIDFWYRFNVVGDALFINRNLSTDREFSIYYSGNNLRFAGYWNSTVQDQGFSWTPSSGQWYHIAIVRHKTNLKAFVDGTQIGSTYNISTYTIRDSSTDLIIGTGTPPEVGYWLNGWMDEVRISKIARWDATFTPPTSEYGSTPDETLTLTELIYLHDEWDVDTNIKELADTINLTDSWYIETDPQSVSLNATINLSDLWSIVRTGTIREVFSTKLYTTLLKSRIYSTDLRCIFAIVAPFYNTKLYLKTEENYIYQTDFRVRFTDLTKVTIGSLDDFIVKLDGVTLSDVDYTSLNIYLNLNTEPSKAMFTLARRHDNLDETLKGVTSTITNVNKVEVYDGTTKLFTGYISEIKADSQRDLVHITAEDVRRKLSRLSVELEYGGEWRVDENNPPTYTRIEKNISTAFGEVMSACGGYILGYDSLPFSGSFVPEYNKTYQDYVSLIDNLIRQTANCHWYIDENERLRFQQIEAGNIKTLNLPSLNSKRHPYDLIVHDVTLNKISNNYAQSLNIKLGKQTVQQWTNRRWVEGNTLIGEYYNQLQRILPKEYTAFGFQAHSLFGGFNHCWFNGEEYRSCYALMGVSQEMDPWFYCGISPELPSFWYASDYMPYYTFMIQCAFMYQWQRINTTTDLTDITVGSGEPKKTLFLTSYGKKISNGHYEERERIIPAFGGSDEKSEVWLAWVRDNTYDYITFATDLANFELSQNNKLLTTANVSLLLDAYKYYGLTFANLINLTNTIKTNIYNNQNGFPLNIEGIHIDCSRRVVNMSLTNYAKSWYAKSQNINTTFEIPDVRWIGRKAPIMRYTDTFETNI